MAGGRVGPASAGGLKVGPREKAWLVLFSVVMTGSVGYRFVVKPRMDMAEDARGAWVRVENEVVQIEAQKPDLAARRARVEALRAQVANTYRELEGSEAGLLRRQDQDILLEQLVAERKRLHLQINAVKPLKEEDASGEDSRGSEGARDETAGKRGMLSFYQRLLVQLDIYGAYGDVVEYVRILETQRPYQRVQGAKVKIEGQDKVRPRALITLETLLADAPEAVEARRREIFGSVEQMAAVEGKDPFLAQEKPKEEVVTVGLDLTGIFGQGTALMAIINGEGYRVGDVIQGKRIVAILADRVVLEQGARRFVLYGRRAGE